MSLEIEIPDRKKFSNSGDFPRKPPSKNHIPFENPKPLCVVSWCADFAQNFCNCCIFHCKKNQHKHDGHPDLNDLIDKYVEDVTK